MSGGLFVFHGHFYQPPRENPWTGLVAREPGAQPFHDWNQRIDDECYRPNAYGRIVDEQDRIIEIVNNYELISFNVGPTLLEWLREHDPLTLARIIEADRASSSRHAGRGSAIAQAYNHMILPLADPRDRVTQIRWGLAVFRFHFGRDAEALWLPETAASHAVLDDLIDHGMRFVILAPGQANRIRPLAGGAWRPAGDSGIDPSVPYLYRHRDGSGRELVVFFYDGPLAHELSFGDALLRSDRFVERVREAALRRKSGPLVHAAADGETAGHHTAWGDRVLAHALARALPAAGTRVARYTEVVDELEPGFEVELDHGPEGEGSSWSCAHGVGRWIRDCGCSISHRPDWNQEWRAGLRAALDLLRDRARPWFEQEAGRIFQDAWEARNGYVEVLLQPTGERRDAFMNEHGRPEATAEDRRRGMALLEMQHHLMLMYTSCGWFFDDIGGLEGRQVLRYAARALEIWEDLGGTPPTREFLDRLGAARSNDPAVGDGASILRSIRDREAVHPRQVLAIALLRAHHEDADAGRFGRWRWEVSGRATIESESQLLHLGRVRIAGDPLGEIHESLVAIGREGDLDLTVYLGPPDGKAPETMERELREAMRRGAVREVLRSEYGSPEFRAETLVNDGGRELLRPVLSAGLEPLRAEVAALVERHGPLLRTGLGEEEADLLTNFAARVRESTLRKELFALVRSGGDVMAMDRALADSGIQRIGLRTVVERAVEEAIAGRRADDALKAIAMADGLDIPLYLHRAQEAWLEHAREFSDTDGARRLGRELGFAPQMCASVLGGISGETAPSGGDGR
jgi:alpha-amylase/alpha-mannosidase (GH57 family)